MNTHASLDKITNLCKRRGFVYQSSEIYGGLESAYDYGYYGMLLKNNIRDYWWKRFVLTREDMIGIDSSIILNPTVWEASGHVTAFNDPQVEDKVTNERYRPDHLIEAWLEKEDNRKKVENVDDIDVDGMSLEEFDDFIRKYNIKSPNGNELTETKKFNQLFETNYGVLKKGADKVYLRGETAQGIFVNFKPVLDSMRVRLPFGIGQVGKSFRNEITKGQFIFRTLEFEQMEIEYFINPDEQDWKEVFEDWKEEMTSFYDELGISRDNLRYREHSDKERSHYSTQTFDIDYEFDFGFKEVLGLAYRGDYDLTQHSKFSGKDLVYRDPYTQKTFVPHVIEPAAGLNRAVMAVLYEAYTEEKLESGKTRTVLKIKPQFAPIKAAIFPLQKDEKLTQKAREIYKDLSQEFVCEFDNAGNIGKMYRRQDEIGTPFCITVDYDSLEDGKVTVRDRDTMEQVRVEIDELDDYIEDRIEIE
jgi:glycyl-tRNA synthetase